MNKKKSGAIYNVEGYGSNDAMMTGLNLYGTSKRAVTHFTQALAKESNEIYFTFVGFPALVNLFQFRI